MKHNNDATTEPLQLTSIEYQIESEQKRGPGINENRTYSGSFTFEVDEESFKSNPNLLALFGVQILELSGVNYIVSKTPNRSSD